MTRRLNGVLDGSGLRVGIVVAKFNDMITSRLLQGAESALSAYGVKDKDVTVASVPGSFEIPIVAKKMAESESYDAVICLGAVVRGETDHYEHIAYQASRGVAEAGLSSGIPVIFGVLTTDTMEQALARAGGKSGESVESQRHDRKPNSTDDESECSTGNIGYSAAMAAIEMINLLRILGSA